VSFSILSLEKSVLKEFVSTWESSSSLSNAEVAQSWIVLATVGGLGAMFTVCILLSALCDWSERQRISTVTALSNQPSDPSASTSMPQRARDEKRILSVDVPDNPGQPRANQDLKLIDESLPAIFRSDPLWVKFKEEMSVYHRWLGIVFYYSPEFPRSMRVLSLFSSIVIMLFVQSVTYNIADPDDGSCEACESESRCLSLRSTLNMRQSRCYWEPTVSTESGESETVGGGSESESGSCHFREIGEDMTRMFIVALLSAIVSAPFALGVQYLIVKVLSKETMSPEEEKKEREKSKALKLLRFLSARMMSIEPDLSTSPDLVESCGRSTQDDLNHLLKEVSAYYKYLQKQKNQQAKEFRGMSTLLLLPSSLDLSVSSLLGTPRGVC
jgi:phosphate/sulfate permease